MRLNSQRSSKPLPRVGFRLRLKQLGAACARGRIGALIEPELDSLADEKIFSPPPLFHPNDGLARCREGRGVVGE